MTFIRSGSVLAFEERGPGLNSQPHGNFLIFTIFYKLFYDFEKWIWCFKTILIILNPNFSFKKRPKFCFLVNTEKRICESNIHRLKNLWCKCFSINACSASGYMPGKQKCPEKTLEFPIYITVGYIITNLWSNCNARFAVASKTLWLIPHK